MPWRRPRRPAISRLPACATCSPRTIEADLRDSASLHGALEAAAPEVVFHLAAQPLVRESYANPRETFDVNVMGTVNLLEAVRVLGRPCVVLVITSDKCYENREQTWGYREMRRLGRPRSLQCQQGGGRDRGGRLPAFVLPARAAPPPRRETGQRAGRQRHRRRRLGQGPHPDRRGSPPPGRPARAGPQSAGHSALAARLGALGRLPDAGRADAPSPTIPPGATPGISVPCRARRFPLRSLWSCSSRPGAAAPGRT